ncbi:MAG: hypothetical protein O3B08_00020 [Proteobacteria bacterium]|nr:hypothetical protein [Pseudomonadota bacterium]
MSRLVILLLLTVAMAMPLSACGKKGDPKPPSRDSEFPRQYPR